MVSFYRYPKEHWIHLRTTNPGAATDRCGETLQVGRQRYGPYLEDLDDRREDLRRLNPPELLKDVYQGMVYLDGPAVPEQSLDKAA